MKTYQPFSSENSEVILTSPPGLWLQSLSVIPSFVTGLLGPLLHLYHHSTGSTEILVAHTALLPPVDTQPLSHSIHPHSLLSATSTQKQSNWNPQWPQLAESQKHSLPDTQPPYSSKHQKGQQKPKNRTHSQQSKSRCQCLELQSSQSQMPRWQHKNTITNISSRAQQHYYSSAWDMQYSWGTRTSK